MNRTALIFAAGDPYLWGDETQYRHLLEVDGEPLINRTIRQLEERAVKPIVVTDNEHLLDLSEETFDPPLCRWWVETCLSTMGLWDGQMIGIYGDVFFTDSAMDMLCKTEGLHFVGRQEPSPLTGGLIECFAWTWDEANKAKFEQALWVGLNHAMEIDPKAEGFKDVSDVWGTIWQPYRYLSGLELDPIEFDHKGLWIELHDFTDDFDTPYRFEAWKEAYARRIVQQYMPPLPKEENDA